MSLPPMGSELVGDGQSSIHVRRIFSHVRDDRGLWALQLGAQKVYLALREDGKAHWGLEITSAFSAARKRGKPLEEAFEEACEVLGSWVALGRLGLA